MNKIILTFDLEYWFESVSIQKHLSGQEKDNISEIIDNTIFALNNKKYSATFFVTKKIITNEPQLIKRIYKMDHEIAIHATDHIPLAQKDPRKLDIEIKEMTNLIESVTGKKPIGYRAVNFSLNNKTKWALKVLSDNNIKYDSSIFPFKLPGVLKLLFKDSMYGVNCHNFVPYQINFDDVTSLDNNSTLTEIPISIFHNKLFKIPITGGIYIRLTPWFIFKKLLRNKLKSEPACLHFHPYDFLTKIPKIKMPIFKKMIKYYNTKNTLKKLDFIINNFECVSIKNYLYENTPN